MEEVTRRALMHTGLALAGSVAGPRLGLAQGRGGKTVKVYGDIPVFDPVISTAYSVHYHSILVYDQLFGIDERGVPRPQMVGKYATSNDKLTWTFELRDGLRFHDGTPVTTADVIPSIRRWASKAGLGPLLLSKVKDISAKDPKTFTVQLKEPFGFLLDALASCYIMRKAEAETDPLVKIQAIVGSGPFRFNQAETRYGNQVVYDRNPDYVPRKEPPSGMAGGKVVKIDRVIYIKIDPTTAVAAVQAGEIDFFGLPPIDMLDSLSSDKSVKLQAINGGEVGYFRLNFLHPPFNNVKCRQALLHLVNQTDYLKGHFANPAYFKTCASYFACGTSMENDANTEWFKRAPNIEKAKQLLKEGGYDGRPVLILQPTNWDTGKYAAEILAGQLRKAGMNAQLVPLEWAGVVARRAVKAAPESGGWNIFPASIAASEADFPLGAQQDASGETGPVGWPTDAKNQELRLKWGRSETLEERKRIAREIQENAWNFVPYVWYGQWVQPSLMRANLKGMLTMSWGGFRAWWNVEKL